MLKLTIYVMTLLVVLRSLTLDSIDLLLKEEFGVIIGSYYLHPVDFCLAVLILLISITNMKLIFRKEVVLLLCFLGCSYFFDLIIANKYEDVVYGNITIAYLKIVIPLITALIIVRYMFLNGISKVIIFILGATYLFVAAQYSILSLFPIDTWIHETINFGIMTIYRCISTSGPPTAGGYVFFFLFLTCVHLIQNKQCALQSRNGLERLIGQKWPMLVAAVLTLTRGLISLAVFAYISDTLKSGRIDRQKFIVMYVFVGIIILLFLTIISARIDGGYAIDGDEARVERLTESFNDVPLSTIIIGNGFGTLYKREVHWYILDSYDFALRAPHNMNVLLLLEIGLIRLIGLYYIFAKIFRRYITRNNTLHAINLVTTLLILFNTETILTFSEYNYAWFIYLASGYYLSDKQE